MESTTTLSLTLPTPLVWGAVTLIGVILASWLVAISLPNAPRTHDPLNRLQTSLGVENVHLVWVLATITLWGGIVAVLVLGLLGLIVETLSATAQSDDYLFYVLRIAGLTGVLGAVIALPLTVIRLRLQTDANITAQEGLITDRINKAIEQLGHGRPAVRMGAILQLERILRDSLQDRVLVLETLNAYVVHKQKKKSGSKTKVVNTPIDVQAALDVMFRQREE